MDTLVLFLILGWMLSVFTIENNVCCRLIIYGIYYIEAGSFSAHFFEELIINGCWILLKAFSSSIEIIIRFLLFNLLICCITLIDLYILKNPCIPGINPTWSWCMSFLMCCWILFAEILLGIFAYMFTGIIFCNLLYFKVYFVWYKDCYSSFLLLPIFMEYVFPSFHFQSMYVLGSEVGFLWTAYIWVLFLFSFSQPVSLGWSI